MLVKKREYIIQRNTGYVRWNAIIITIEVTWGGVIHTQCVFTGLY